MKHRRLRFESLESRKVFAGPWTNPDNNTDINADGRVGPLDVMIIFEALLDRPNGEGFPANRNENGPFVDVNADGLFSPIDLLLVINQVMDSRPIVFAKLANDTAAGGGTNTDRSTADATIDGRIDYMKSTDVVLAGWDIANDSQLQDITAARAGNTFRITESLTRQLNGGPLTDGKHQLTVTLRRGQLEVYRLNFGITYDSSQR